ncbi:MAG: hypothetical protein GVY25_11540 [Bacteroidetes bacterium]|jgi:hypothetical protein|nr:hypothetical protein [Bacteroidota bacterium]
MNRRRFLTRTALLGSGLAIRTRLPSTAPQSHGDDFPATTPNQNDASPEVTADYPPAPLAPRLVVSDALCLANAMPSLPAQFRDVLALRREFAVAADAVTAAPDQTLDLLTRLRTGWADRDQRSVKTHRIRGDMFAFRLAWAAGRLAHDAAQPVLGTPADAEARRVRDARVLLALRAANPGPPPPTVEAAGLGALLRAIDQRTAMRMHTFEPDREDAASWIPRFVNYHRASRAEADALAQAMSSTDPDSAFLAPTDPAFRLARAARRAHPVTPNAITDALNAPGDSDYARALAVAARMLVDVGRFFDGTLTRAALRARLD